MAQSGDRSLGDGSSSFAGATGRGRSRKNEIRATPQEVIRFTQLVAFMKHHLPAELGQYEYKRLNFLGTLSFSLHDCINLASIITYAASFLQLGGGALPECSPL